MSCVSILILRAILGQRRKSRAKVKSSKGLTEAVIFPMQAPSQQESREMTCMKYERFQGLVSYWNFETSGCKRHCVCHWHDFNKLKCKSNKFTKPWLDFHGQPLIPYSAAGFDCPGYGL